MQDFRKFSVLFLETLRHEVRLHKRERLIAFRCLPQEFIFNDAKVTFFIVKKWFSDPELYFLHISAIFNKNEKFSCL